MSTAKWKKRTGMNWKQWRALRATIAAGQKFICPHCEKRLNLSVRYQTHLHHVNGDTLDNWSGNLQAVHYKCHKEIHAIPVIVSIAVLVPAHV